MITYSKDPTELLKQIAVAIKPTRALALALAESQRSRMLKRTDAGKDFSERAFSPYSTNGPYYYNPTGASGKSDGKKVNAKQQHAAAKRFLGKITTKAQRERASNPFAPMSTRNSSGTPHLSRTGRTVVFRSYSAFKKWLGRTNVDLRGPRAPHMLQAMQAKGTEAGGQVQGVIGIYGEAAKRASGHNNGARHLPQRRFLAASRADELQMRKEVEFWIGKQIK